MTFVVRDGVDDRYQRERIVTSVRVEDEDGYGDRVTLVTRIGTPVVFHVHAGLGRTLAREIIGPDRWEAGPTTTKDEEG